MPTCVRASCQLRDFRAPQNRSAEGAQHSKPLYVRSAEITIAREVSAGPADTLLWSQPQRRNCSLRFLGSLVHGFSFVSVREPILLRHWLNHYVVGLGIPPRNLGFVVHVSTDTGAEESALLDVTFRALSNHGISVDRQARIHRGRYTDAERLDAVNEFVSHLPNQSWMVFADSDEFFSYPCNLASKVHGYDAFSAVMRDRLSSNGSIAPLRDEPDISVQFPIECGLRQALSSDARKGQFHTGKIVLFRVEAHSLGVRRFFRSPHNLNTPSSLAARLGDFAHYTLTAEAMLMTHGKVDEHRREATKERDALAVQNTVMLRNGSELGAAQPSHIQCSLRREPGTPCQDYTRILAFMQAQDYEPWRPLTATGCRVPTFGSVTSRILR